MSNRDEQIGTGTHGRETATLLLLIFHGSCKL